MITRLVRRLHRDRRRISVTLTLLFCAGVVEMWNKSDALPPGVLEVSAGLFMMVFMGSFLISLGIALPAIRHAYAPIGFTLFAAAVLGRLLPGSAFSLMTVTEGGFRSLAGLSTTGLFVQFLFYGRWTDRFMRLRRSRTTTRVTTRLESDEVWHGLVPTPGQREALHDPDVVSVDWLDRDHRRVRVIRWSPPEPQAEEHLQIEEILQGAYVVYRYVRPGSKPDSWVKGLRAVKVIDLVDKRVVYVTEFRQDRPLRRVMFDWLDDALGREEDDRVHKLEVAIAATRGKGAAVEDTLAIGGTLRRRPKEVAKPKAPTPLRKKRPERPSWADAKRQRPLSLAGE